MERKNVSLSIHETDDQINFAPCAGGYSTFQDRVTLVPQLSLKRLADHHLVIYDNYLLDCHSNAERSFIESDQVGKIYHVSTFFQLISYIHVFAPRKGTRRKRCIVRHELRI